jgi:surfactin synthase thioesterase subunit
VKKKNQTVNYNLVFCQCPEQDSNLHTVAGTSPSSWRVYQFHHLGEERLKGTEAQRLNGHQPEILIKKELLKYVLPLRRCAFAPLRRLVPRTGLEPAHHC